MANSLEARVPFLGRKVIEFAFSLSEEDCCSKNDLKHILKETYDNVIPKQILYRQKRGFAIPPDYFSARRKNRPITCELLNRYWRELVKKDV
jgi:asparagine synthase (glutamine-hydrolysing)